MYKTIIIITSILFLVNPFSAIIFIMCCWLFIIRNLNSKFGEAFFIFLALYLSLLNANRVWASDTLSYVLWMQSAERTPFWEYMYSKSGQEPFFFFTNYIFCHLTNGWGKLYLLIYNLFFYYFFLRGIYLFGKAHTWKSSIIYFSFFIACFLITYFTPTLQLMRQCLVGVMILYIYVQKIYYGLKGAKLWFLLLCMVGIHSSSLIFIFILFIPFLNKKFSLRSLSTFLFITVIVCLGFRLFSGISGMEETSVAGQIVSRGNLDVKTEVEKITLGGVIPALCNFIGIIFTYIYYRNKLSTSDIYFFNLNLLFMIMVFSLPFNSFVQARLMGYVGYTLPFSLAYLLKGRSLFFGMGRILTMTVLLSSFIIYVLGAKSAVKYPINDMLVYSLFDYLKDNAL